MTQVVESETRGKPLAALVLSLVVSIIALPLRVGDRSFFAFISRSLWAEDGNIFLNQTAAHGIESLWLPYAGYLHFYPRVFTLLSYRFELIYVPWILAFGYALAFAYTMYVVGQRLLAHGSPFPISFCFALLIACQPQTGEIFLTITNAQWFLAVALSIVLLIPARSRARTEPLVVLALALTGPFCVLLVPAMLLHVAINRDVDNRWPTYAALLLGAIIQACFIVLSGRGSDTGISSEWQQWARLAFDTVTFGGNNWAVIAASAAFWLLFFYGSHAVTKRMGYRSLALPATLLSAAGCLYLGGMWAFKDAPGGLHPVLANARYFLGPYSLLFMAAALVWSRVPKLIWPGIASLAAICVVQFQTIERQDLQFPSYAAFAGQLGELKIPLPPANAEFPGWHIEADLLAPARPTREAIRYTGDAALATLLVPRSQELSLETRDQCQGSEHVGIEVQMTRPNAGWTKLTWTAGGRQVVLPRFYPEGRIKAQYAYPRGTLPEDLRLDPGAPLERLTVHAVDLYCL